MNQKKHRLNVFLESLYNDKKESHSKNIHGNFVLYSPAFFANTGEYGAENPLFIVNLCSAYQLTDLKLTKQIKTLKIYL